jgi:hypothetical protein
VEVAEVVHHVLEAEEVVLEVLEVLEGVRCVIEAMKDMRCALKVLEIVLWVLRFMLCAVLYSGGFRGRTLCAALYTRSCGGWVLFAGGVGAAGGDALCAALCDGGCKERIAYLEGSSNDSQLPIVFVIRQTPLMGASHRSITHESD